MFRRTKSLILALLAAGLASGARAWADPPVTPTGNLMSVGLSRGAFTVFRYPAKAAQASAIILFASGDGGWTYWEEKACHALADAGFDAIGIDSVAYASTDYSLDVLQMDFGRIAQASEQFHAEDPLPVIIGGYSMGAEQAVPAAGGPHCPAGVVGLLLVSPGKRGRYGLRSSDQWGIAPTGPGTFALADFARTLGDLRVIQWHGGYDPLDSRDWLASLTSPHREFDYDSGWHNYKSACDEFLARMCRSVSWILEAPAPLPDSLRRESSPVELGRI